MIALADRLLTALLALAGYAALRSIAARAHDELAAERAAAAARDTLHAQQMLELVAAVQAPGTHIPMVETGPGLSQLTISEDDELQAWSQGERQAAADAVMAELEARERQGIPTTDEERFHLRDVAEGLVPPSGRFEPAVTT